MENLLQHQGAGPAGQPSGGPVLSIRDLVVEFATPAGVVRAADGVSYEVRAGETLCVVGETGSGKSVTVLAALGLLRTPNLRRVSGQALLGGVDLLALPDPQLRQRLGRDVAMVFQDPGSSLNPVQRVGDQIAEALLVHDRSLPARAARARVVELLGMVGVPHPEIRYDQYPHQFSGGMSQRAMIAMAIANQPKVLIADEPTSALDVSVQAQILDVLRVARQETGAAVVLITHDLGVVAETADRVCVMHGGRVVETGDVTQIFGEPRDAYTAKLLGSVPRLDVPAQRLREPDPARPPVLRIENAVKRFAVRSGVFARAGAWVHAVDGVSLEVAPGRTLGLVGESGCGKSTLARMILRLVDATGGQILVDGADVARAGRAQLRLMRRRVQMVFQDPYASLNPRLTVGDNVAEPLRLHGGFSRPRRRQLVLDLFEKVGLRPEHADRFPSEFSGGQRQRAAIARALALRPQLMILDEPVSSLDVSVQAQVLKLLDDLQREHGMAYLFVSHDLSVVRQVADEVAVMYLGKIVELGPAGRVYDNPRHPYTRALLASVPVPDPAGRERRTRAPLSGDVPSPANPPSGCRFRTRCPMAQAICAQEEPPLREVEGGRTACHFAELTPEVQP